MFPHLDSYCVKAEVPSPEWVERNPGHPDLGHGVACADFAHWRIYFVRGISETTGAHELAHLLTNKDGDRGDSHAHGPKFQAHQLAIENWCRDERRRELRAGNNG